MTTQTLNIALCLKVGQNYGQTDGRTDDPNTRCPRRTFQAGGHKNCLCAEQLGFHNNAMFLLNYEL